ncbi:MAG: restriction endonuclease subunit S, partial [Atribacterota bacterium]|nr:restriction endonuclease subunit S [Atribacterota bacterium]
MLTTIDKLFDLTYGQKEYHNKERLEGNEGSNILISSKGEDGGLYGFFNIPNKFKAPVITVPSTGTIGQAFVQENDCSVDDNCLVLTPKKKMSMEKLFQIAYQIRINKWRYKYGRQITPLKLGKQTIKIEDFKIDYNDCVKKLLPRKKTKINIKENGNINKIPLIDLCYIVRKTAKPKNSMDNNGSTPYITTSSKDNGISEFVNERPNSKGKCLTVALNGSCGQTFFQFDDFITSGDNAILTLKDAYNPYLLFYIGFQIYRQRWGFNYYRKLSENRLKKMKIPMPVKNGKYDLDYIENMIK